MPPIDELTRIEPVLLSRLDKMGIFTTGLLLEVSETPTRRQTLADQMATDTTDVLAWRDEALMLNLASFGPDEHQLMIQAHIEGIRSILDIDQATFRERVHRAAGELQVDPPSDLTLEGWWDQARTLAEPDATLEPAPTAERSAPSRVALNQVPTPSDTAPSEVGSTVRWDHDAPDPRDASRAPNWGATAAVSAIVFLIIAIGTAGFLSGGPATPGNVGLLGALIAAATVARPHTAGQWIGVAIVAFGTSIAVGLALVLLTAFRGA